ncbi:hypothetical protein BGZ63DRAFT_514274, partial [Mariannaea sp. PMI_226]
MKSTLFSFKHDDEEEDSFLNHSDSAGLSYRDDHWRRWPSMLYTGLNIFFFICSCSLWIYWYHTNNTLLNAGFRQISSWTPLIDLVDLDPSVQLVNGTFFPPKYPSIGRQLPNDAADAAWHEYEIQRIVPISRQDVINLGKDPSTAVKLEDKDWGLGNDSYVAALDVYHQLHCLNMLRKIAYGQYYNMSQGSATSLTRTELHINHCVDIIMQALQCSGNLNLITYHWVETQPYPFPDMSVNRQCANFGALTSWRKENTVNMTKYDEVYK